MTIMCNILHFKNGEKDLALELFKDGYNTEAYKSGSKYTKPDFMEFATRIGMNKIRIDKIYSDMLNKSDDVEIYVYNSFLKGEIKKAYIKSYYERLKRLVE